ncbi:hypothetical protein TNCV_1881871 [Trichonephila clavipes]|nr:hypothetical protein TNCV_1881871 [Trichonephila clavipes]
MIVVKAAPDVVALSMWMLVVQTGLYPTHGARRTIVQGRSDKMFVLSGICDRRSMKFYMAFNTTILYSPIPTRLTVFEFQSILVATWRIDKPNSLDRPRTIEFLQYDGSRSTFLYEAQHDLLKTK